MSCRPAALSHPLLGLAAASVALLALTSCGGGGGGREGGGASGVGSPSPVAEPATSASASAVPPTVSAEVVQYRRDAQRGVVQVKVTNHGAAALRVDAVELTSTTFAADAVADKDSLVGAGLSVDLTVPLPPPACTAPVAGVEEVRLLVSGVEVTLPVDDAVLQQVRERRCAEQAVGEVVALSFAPTWQDAGPVGERPALRGRLVAAPAPGVTGSVRVDGATTLFTVAGRSEVELDGPGEVALDVVVTVTRCDAHAVAEDKKGYLFPVRVTTDDLDEVLVEVAVPVPERAPLQDLIDRTCR